MLPCIPKRLVVACHPVDFRKSWNGLLDETYKMGFDPYKGDCVVFVKRDKRQLRALLGDALGLIMISRRFDGGPLGFKWLTDGEVHPETITPAQLTMMLEGASCRVDKRVKQWDR